jgi:hypothetical protein
MTNPLPENKRSQKAKVGRDATIVGRDYTHTTNISLWVSFFLIGVVALGGLAWAFNVGLIRNSGNPQVPQPNVTSTEKSAKP